MLQLCKLSDVQMIHAWWKEEDSFLALIARKVDWNSLRLINKTNISQCTSVFYRVNLLQYLKSNSRLHSAYIFHHSIQKRLIPKVPNGTN
jgi:hypothetical protein